MKKKSFLILSILLVFVMMAGCAKNQSEQADISAAEATKSISSETSDSKLTEVVIPENDNIQIIYKESKAYTNKDLEAAAKLIVKECKGKEDFKLKSLSYAGDDISSEQIKKANSMQTPEGKYIDVIAFNVEYSIEKNSADHTSLCVVAREAEGEWTFIGMDF